MNASPRPEGPFPRSAGILLHPTSLPGRYGIGDLGEGARRFVDFLADSGLSLWQVLPLVPPGPGSSPYSSPSAFAGNIWLLDADHLYAHALIDTDDLQAPTLPEQSIDFADFALAYAAKKPLLDKACARFAARLPQASDALSKGFADFCNKEQHWLDDYALFMALRDHYQQAPWWLWPDAARKNHDDAAVAQARQELHDEILRIKIGQYLFDVQWRQLQAYCQRKGVRIIGDIPIYVDRDSADVWANRQYFRFQDDGLPSHVAGVPPDAFTEKGQFWGNPLYNWDALAADGHRFWVLRMQRALSLADVVRIDHFRAFAAFWEIPADAPDASSGVWVRGPGSKVFADLQTALQKDLGTLPVIAEDLGVIDQPVVDLRKKFLMPGMKVLQFAFGGAADHDYLPHTYDANTVVYTGTHDNDTALGYWLTSPDYVKKHFQEYTGLANPSGHDVVWHMIRLAFSCVSHTAIVPMQDILALDSGARMNIPGKSSGNWRWRVRIEAFHSSLSSRLRYLSRLYDRDEKHRDEVVAGREQQARANPDKWLPPLFLEES